MTDTKPTIGRTGRYYACVLLGQLGPDLDMPLTGLPSCEYSSQIVLVYTAPNPVLATCRIVISNSSNQFKMTQDIYDEVDPP